MVPMRMAWLCSDILVMVDREQSKAGIVAEINWCGTKILTGDRWNCSTSAPNKWMQPLGCDDGCAATDGSCGMCTTPGTLWGAPCAINDVVCDQDRAFSQATAEPHARGEAHCRPCCQQPDTVPGGCLSDDDMDACCGGHVSDDLQATQEQISTNAKWIWSGDFVRNFDRILGKFDDNLGIFCDILAHLTDIVDRLWRRKGWI